MIGYKCRSVIYILKKKSITAQRLEGKTTILTILDMFIEALEGNTVNRNGVPFVQ